MLFMFMCLLHLPELISTECELFDYSGSKLFYCNKDDPYEVNYFELLKYDGEMIIVGGKNRFYNFSLNSLKYVKFEWNSNEFDHEICFLKTQSMELCNNFLRIYEDISHDHFLLCGTHALKPLCRIYKKKDENYIVVDEYDAEGICPHSPFSRSTAIVIDGKIFAATYDDDNDNNGLIYRNPVRTENENTYQLNEPKFVGSFRYEKYVYFFFSEKSEEIIDEMTVHSKMARVCINDQGYGNFNGKKRWTSFFKTNLICSASGKHYYNKIQAVSDIIYKSHNKEDQIFYALFQSVPSNINGESAVCVFNMKNVEDSFNGNFRGEMGTAYGYPEKTIISRPGTCANYSAGVSSELEKFLNDHCSMDQPVRSFLGDAILVNTNKSCPYTSIFIDPQIEIINKRKYDVLYIGTECGAMMKVLNRNGKTFIIETLKYYPTMQTIKSIRVHKEVAMVISDSAIALEKMHRCELRGEDCCKECVSLRDPYCAWSKKSKCCKTIFPKDWTSAELTDLLQDVEDDNENLCIDAPDDSKISASEYLKSIINYVLIIYWIILWLLDN